MDNTRLRKAGSRSNTETTFRKEKNLTDEAANSSKTPSKGCATYVMYLLLAAGLAVLLLVMSLPCPIDPISFKLPPPPSFTGPLTPNNKLTEAERLFENEIVGPESIVAHGDHLYTGVVDGRVLDIYKGEMRVLARLGPGPCGGEENEPTCGRPLGMRMNKDGHLLVVDAYLGVFKINVSTGQFEQLFNPKKAVDGKVPKFMNDLDIGSDGTLYLTHASTKFDRRNHVHNFIEARQTGRVMAFTPSTGETRVLIDGLSVANGIQLSEKEDFLLISEMGRARIWRYWLKGDKSGEVDIFCESLPGSPDNIRRTTRGTFWVGFATTRRADKFSMADYQTDKPWIRRLNTMLFSQDYLFSFIPKYGLLVEINHKGEIINSLHDPTGKRISMTSEAKEHDGYLYVGSYGLPYLSRVRLA